MTTVGRYDMFRPASHKQESAYIQNSTRGDGKRSLAFGIRPFQRRQRLRASWGKGGEQQSRISCSKTLMQNEIKSKPVVRIVHRPCARRLRVKWRHPGKLAPWHRQLVHPERKSRQCIAQACHCNGSPVVVVPKRGSCEWKKRSFCSSSEVEYDGGPH